MWKRCPKRINSVVGYRTSRSMKNMDTWRFANEYCGKLWLKIGLVLLVLSVLVHIPFYRSSENTVSTVALILCLVQMVVLIIPIFPTEAALKKRFFDDGTRR